MKISNFKILSRAHLYIQGNISFSGTVLMMSLMDKILANTLFHGKKKDSEYLLLDFIVFSSDISRVPRPYWNRTEKCALNFRKCTLGLLAKAESWLRNTSNQIIFSTPCSNSSKCALGELLKSVRYRSQIPTTG